MIRVDSRLVQKNDIFIALKGISSDGHDYIEQAIKNGAKEIIAEHGSYIVKTTIVKDTREYLTDYLTNEYKNMLNDMTIIGITGTNGKTTTAFLIYQALNKLNIKCAYIGTIGFYLDKKIKNLSNTTPDILDLYEMFIESYNKGYKHIIIEVSSQALSYKRVDQIYFDYALFTNLTRDHLDYHKTMDNYCNAKVNLFKQLKNNKIAIINYDDSYKDKFTLKENNNIYYGFNGGDIKIENYLMSSNETLIKYKYNNNLYETKTKLIGKYNIYNVSLAISLLIKMNINVDEINKVIPLLTEPNGRMDKTLYNSNTIIIDYAHTADAFIKIFDTVKEIKPNNIYTTFGCTGDRDREKRSIMTDLALTNSTKVIITNDDPHTEDINQIINDMLKNQIKKNYEICLDRSKAIEKGIKLLKENDILLILGKGHEEFMIIGNNKIPFNDKNEVNKYLQKLHQPN